MQPVTKPQEALTETEVLESWIDDPDAVQLFTHQHVDADAVLSVAIIRLVKPEVELRFVPANTTVTDTDAIAVDMLNGPRAVKGLKQGSAFGLIVETLASRDKVWKIAFGKWAKQLNITDSGKYCKDALLFVQLVRSWRVIGLDDAVIVDRAEEILRGRMKIVCLEKESRKATKDIPIHNGVALVLEGMSADRHTLFKRGVRAVIYHGESFGQCVMLSKKELATGRTLGELDGRLPDHWFIHPAGFLAAHGTKKAPQSLETSGISLETLCALISSWLNEDAMCAQSNNRKAAGVA